MQQTEYVLLTDVYQGRIPKAKGYKGIYTPQKKCHALHLKGTGQF